MMKLLDSAVLRIAALIAAIPVILPRAMLDPRTIDLTLFL
jgi:hypothetical protein